MENEQKIERAFCPICGELEIRDGKIIHPELDKEIKAYTKSVLENGAKIHYVKLK